MSVILPIDQVSKSCLETLNACPYCGSRDCESLIVENGYQYVECRKCQLIYLKDRLKFEHLGLIYGNASYHNVENINYEKIIAKKRLALLGKLPPELRIHEDGAGNGAFVAAAKEQGHLVTGSDLGEDAVKKAKNIFGIDLLYSDLVSIRFPDEELDVMASFNLLCHLYEPWNYIKEVSRILRMGGFFLLRTGNRQGRFKIFGKLSAPEHVFHFNINILSLFFQQNRMRIVWVKPAFDSDYPYFLFDAKQSSKGVKKRLASFGNLWSWRLWNFLGLRKEDVYILVVKE